MQKQLIGSSVAIAFGILMFVGGINPPTGAVVTGLMIVIGSLACRSRKKRNLGLVPQRERRIGAEYSAMLIVGASILFKRDLLDQLYYEPVSNLFIPAWIFIAYAMAGRRRSGSPAASAPAATR